MKYSNVRWEWIWERGMWVWCNTTCQHVQAECSIVGSLCSISGELHHGTEENSHSLLTTGACGALGGTPAPAKLWADVVTKDIGFPIPDNDPPAKELAIEANILEGLGPATEQMVGLPIAALGGLILFSFCRLQIRKEHN